MISTFKASSKLRTSDTFLLPSPGTSVSQMGFSHTVAVRPAAYLRDVPNLHRSQLDSDERLNRHLGTRSVVYPVCAKSHRRVVWSVRVRKRLGVNRLVTVLAIIHARQKASIHRACRIMTIGKMVSAPTVHLSIVSKEHRGPLQLRRGVANRQTEFPGTATPETSIALISIVEIAEDWPNS